MPVMMLRAGQARRKTRLYVGLVVLLAAAAVAACGVGDRYESDFPVVVVNKTVNAIEVTANGSSVGDVAANQSANFSLKLPESNQNIFSNGVAPTGSITFTSGGMSTRPRPGSAMLTSMLAAVEALAPALALELAPVRVNVVTPGLIDTPLLDTTYGAERDKLVQSRAAVLPGKRVGTAEEVAEVILLLMTNRYITGEVVRIDGGSRFL